MRRIDRSSLARRAAARQVALLASAWLLSACAEGRAAEPPPADGATADAATPSIDALTPEVPIDAGNPDATLAVSCVSAPCGAGTCCHFGVCVPGGVILFVCVPDDSVPECDEATPCAAADQCCHFDRCIPGSAPTPGICVPRTE